MRDLAGLELKADHAARPVYVSPDGHVFLETVSPIYREAYDFVIAIAEPISRPRFVHEYRLTPYSLYAGVSVGLDTQTIIRVLDRFSKAHIPDGVVQFIRERTERCGKVKLVLKQGRYHLESPFPDVLQTLLTDRVIGPARAVGLDGAQAAVEACEAPRRGDLQIAGVLSTAATAVAAAGASAPSADAPHAGGVAETAPQQLRDIFDAINRADDDIDESVPCMQEADHDGVLATMDVDAAPPASGTVHAIEIKPTLVEAVKRQCVAVLDYPLLEEYDFRHDTMNEDLPISLRPLALLRPYQEKSLNKMFGNGRARSGIIVLPCGAGKTLVGVAATSTIHKRTLVLTTSSVAVEQWRQQYLQWSTIEPDRVVRFTADARDLPVRCGVYISTYTMIAFSGHRSAEAEAMMAHIESLEWSLLILDEVHVVPADMFRKVLEVVPTHCKLGLSATLVREDDKIDDLNYLIGPKLYEANWMDLERRGYIARVSCAEVRCPMQPEFYRKYLEAQPRMRVPLWTMNPIKFQYCQFLVQYHEQRGDKIIVFSDSLFALRNYARKLGKYFIDGATPFAERMGILQQFRDGSTVNCICTSKIADNAFDLPDANVLIQISSHFGSRRQEAQRLGRILRPKRNCLPGEYNAYFYTLVSCDTQEMYYSMKRQQFLLDQGYAFKIVTRLPIEGLNLHFSTLQEQRDLLAAVLSASDPDLADGEADETPDGLTTAKDVASSATSRTRGLASLSGADNTLYLERRGTRAPSKVSLKQLVRIFYEQ